MRVELERGYTTARVKTGLFSSTELTTQDIRLTFAFTEEEIAVIASGLGDYLFYEAPLDPILIAENPKREQQWKDAGINQIPVRALVQSPVQFYRYKNLIEANNGEANLLRALEELKAAIEAHKGHGKPGPRVIDL